MGRSRRAYSRTIGLLLAGVGAFLGLALVPSGARRAQAYCQLTTIKPADGQLCSSEGVAASWHRSCISISLNDPGPTLPSLDEMRAAAAAAYGAWTAVQCDGHPIGLSVEQTEKLAECSVPEYNRTAPNANTIAFLSDWSAYEMSADAFGLTIVQLNPDTGEIYGADTVLNEGLGPLKICGTSCPRGAVDVQNVMTHEAGHFFGLGHTDASHSDATMWASASVGETQKRSLAADDIAGICAIYGARSAANCKQADYTPNHGFAPQCSPPPLERSPQGCSCYVAPHARAHAPRTTIAWTSVTLAFAVLCAARLRKRNARGPRGHAQRGKFAA